MNEQLSDVLTLSSSTVSFVCSVIAGAVGMFLILRISKWISGSEASPGKKTLDQRITSKMPQNSYGKYRGDRKSAYYRPGHE